MKNENKILSILIVVLLCAISFIVWSGEITSYKLIEGKIVNVETIYKDDENIDYMVLYFDDGRTIKIYEPVNNYYDLTVNSKQVIKLLKRPWDEHWTIYKLIKVPEV